MPIAVDASTNSGYQAASSSYSWSHTCSGTNRILVVSIALLNVANDVATLTYGGISLNRLRSDVDGTGTIRTDIYYLLAPATGANTIAITLNQASVSASMATSYTGVSQYTPVDAQNGTTGTTGAGGGSASLATTVVTEGAWIVDAIATVDTAITVGSGQNQRSNVTGAVGSGGQSDKTNLAAGSQTMQWDNVAALTSWTMSTLAMLPATTMGTTTSTSSTSSTSTSISSTSSSTSSISTSTSSTSRSTSSTSFSSTSSSVSTSSTSFSTSSTSSSTSSTSISSTSSSTSISSTSSSISSTSFSSTSSSSTSSSTSKSSTSTSFSSTSSSISSTSASTSSTSFSSTSSSTSTSTTAIPLGLDFSYQDISGNAAQYLIDPFNQNSLNANLWTQFTAGSATFTYDSTGATVNYPASSTSSTDGDISSNIPWNLVNSYFEFHVIAVPSAATSADAEIRMRPILLSGSIDTKAWVRWVYEGGTLFAQKRVNDSNTTLTSFAYNSTTHAYWRIREFNGVTFWDTTSDPALGWTNQAKAPNEIKQSAVTVLIAGTCFQNESNPGTFKWNNFNSVSTSLLDSFTNAQYSDVAGDDGDYFIEYGSEYMVREYKKKWTNNTDSIRFTWRGRSTQSTAISPILIQIYNVSTASWETLAQETRVPADTDFSATVNQSTSLSNYYDVNNVVTFRSYQQVI